MAQPDARRSTTHTSRDTMADNKEALRALKIKTGVMTRVRKELAMYEQEVKTETEKLEAMKAEGRDPHDVKQQDQVLGESTMMIGDCKSRMESAFNDLLAAERDAGGVLSVDAETPASITSHAPGYLLSKEEDVIVGLQSDEPLKRTCKPHGGYGVVRKALEAYGYEPGEKLRAFKDDVVTHNDLTFSMYTDKVRMKGLLH